MSNYEFWDELGNIFDAVMAYQRKTVEFNKRFITPWIQFGNVFDQQDSNNKVIQAYQKAVEIDPDNAENWYELGNAYFSSGYHDEAKVTYRKALDLNPQMGWAYSNLAYTLAIQDKLADAVPLYLKSIENLDDDRDRAVSWNRLGNVYRKLNEYEKALFAFKEADKFDSENSGFRDEFEQIQPAEQNPIEDSPIPPADWLNTSVSIDVPGSEDTADILNQAAAPEESPIEPVQEPENPLPIIPEMATTYVEEAAVEVSSQSETDIADGTSEVIVPEPQQVDLQVPDNNAPESSTAVIETNSVVDITETNTILDERHDHLETEDNPNNETPELPAEAELTNDVIETVSQNEAVTFTDYDLLSDISIETTDDLSVSNQVTMMHDDVQVEVNEEEQPEAQIESVDPVDHLSVMTALQADAEIVESNSPAQDLMGEEAMSIGQPASNSEIPGEGDLLDLAQAKIDEPVEEQHEETVPQDTDQYLISMGDDPHLQPGTISWMDDNDPFPGSDTKNARAWNELGNVYFNEGSYDDATSAYSKAIELDRSFAWAYSNLALAYFQNGRFAESILLYQRSIELFQNEKDKAVSWNRLGNVYRRLNDYDNAIAAYQRADELDPDNTTRSLRIRFSLLGNNLMEQKSVYLS